MAEFPDWVPTEVIDYFESLRAGKRPHGTKLDFDDSDVDALYRTMASTKMKKAWQAILRRRHKANPEQFAFAILASAYSCRINVSENGYPTLEEISEYEDMLKKLRFLQVQFKEAFEHWPKSHIDHYFGEQPSIVLQKIADDLSATIFHKKRIRNSLRKVAGKPQSESGPRTFIIRSLSERLKRLYGQPLHKTVALTAGAMIDEDIDEEIVRKLVS